MKLYDGKTSPYVRKVLVAAQECGLEDRIEREEVLPWEPDTKFAEINPLGKIPALVTDDGRLIYDSRVIVEYLDAQHDGPKLIPDDLDGRMEAMRLNSLGDGMMEAMILVYSELVRRPENLRWTYWEDRMRGKVDTALDCLEQEVAGFDQTRFDLGQITNACAVGWLEFRKHILNIDFRPGRPKLAAWFETVDARPSMRATVPVAPA